MRAYAIYMYACICARRQEREREIYERCKHAMHTRVYMHTLSLNYVAIGIAMETH